MNNDVKVWPSLAWIRTPNFTGFEVSQLIDSKKPSKSSKAPKAGLWYKIGTKILSAADLIFVSGSKLKRP
jgi:hypothetical protein